MTASVLEEVRECAKRNKVIHKELVACADAESAIKYFADSAKVNPKQKRTWYIAIAALAIAAIEAMDAEVSSDK